MKKLKMKNRMRRQKKKKGRSVSPRKSLFRSMNHKKKSLIYVKSLTGPMKP